MRTHFVIPRPRSGRWNLVAPTHAVANHHRCENKIAYAALAMTKWVSAVRNHKVGTRKVGTREVISVVVMPGAV